MLAVHLACRSLHGGDSDLAFAGGACVILDPRKFASGSAQGVLSPRAVSVGGFGWSAVHNVCVGGLGWVADAPEVPSSHRLLSLTCGCPLSVAGLGGSRGVVTVDRAERR